MRIDRKHHLQFLEDELKAETEEFKKKYMTTAISLLKQSEEMFVGQFISFKDGEMKMKFPNTRSLPRKGEFLLCMLLPSDLRIYKNWKNLTYCDLYKQRFHETESVCIWHKPADDKRFSIVGFSKISMDFANQIFNDLHGLENIMVAEHGALGKTKEIEFALVKLKQQLK